MNRIKSCAFLFFALLLLCLPACRTNAKDTQAAGQKNYEAEGFVKAEIKKYDVDGCGFMLFLNETKKLNPKNLDEKFKKEGLKVWVKYTVDKKVMSICMAGENVTITAIELRAQ
jgi:hypothetical protein